jgi:hypothetical protein
LAFTIGSGNERLRRELITAYSEDGLTVASARGRLAELQSAIRTFETLHHVHYRPEKPDFSALVHTAEAATAGRLDEEAIEAALANR